VEPFKLKREHIHIRSCEQQQKNNGKPYHISHLLEPPTAMSAGHKAA